MAKSMFDLDNDLIEINNDYSDMLKKANIFCMREQYDKALEIYNRILDEDMENEAAYLGILKVHSEYYTKYEGNEIEKDIRIIERMFPNINNKEYVNYCLERKKHKVEDGPEKDILFGSYYSNADKEKAPLKWDILEKKDGKLLIITHDIIDVMPFNTNGYDTKSGFEKATIREWLNKDFYNIAFNEEEKKQIQLTLVDNSIESTCESSLVFTPPKWKNTKDKIFLLSRMELNKYYQKTDDRKAKGTEYAKSKKLKEANGGSGCWWLRSYKDASPFPPAFVFWVTWYGDIGEQRYENSFIGIRPVCWIKLK